MKILKKNLCISSKHYVTVSLAGCAMPASPTGKPDESFSDFCDDVFKDQFLLITLRFIRSWQIRKAMA